MTQNLYYSVVFLRIIERAKEKISGESEGVLKGLECVKGAKFTLD
jgi:hypothetical protein